MIDFTKLSKSLLIKPKVLTEAENYDIADDVYAPPPREQTDEATNVSSGNEQVNDTQPATDDTVNISSENDDADSGAEASEDTVQIDSGDSDEGEVAEDLVQTDDEIIDEAKAIPDMKILTNLSDEEYNLNNYRCYENFMKLQEMTKNIINNNIMDTVTDEEYQDQALTLVYNNLSGMLEDIDNYLMYRFTSVYEKNVVAYLTFVKRYQTAMKLIRLALIDKDDDKKSK